jgi:FkbM family methyltransferase
LGRLERDRHSQHQRLLHLGSLEKAERNTLYHNVCYQFDQFIPEPTGQRSDKRIEITARCRDMDDVPRVPRAGQVEILEDGTRVQLMHNGLQILADAYLGTWTTQLIERCRGCHEPQEERVFRDVMARLPDDATMIELGGYWAFYSLWFLLCGKNRRSIVLEPDPKHLTVGQRNARLNGLTPTFVHGFTGGEPSPSVLFRTEDSGDVLAPCLSVPLLMERHGIQQLDILHSDTQGAEHDVLLDCKELFEQQRIKFLFVSTHDFTISGDPLTHQRCLTIVRSCGGRIIAEHDIHESFSGDGLIAAYFGGDAFMATSVSVSRNRYSESLFRNPLYDLAEIRAHAEDLGAKLQSEQVQTANLQNALKAERAQAANLHNALQAEQAEVTDLHNALQTEQAQSANLHNTLQTERTHVANLHNALHAEQAHVTSLHTILRTEQAHVGHLLGRVRQLEAGLAVQSHYRRVFGGVREIGDRITGGGLRSLAKRLLTTLVQRSMRHRGLLALGRFLLKPFPKLATSLYQLATRSEPTAALPAPSPAALPDGPLPSNAPVIAAALPASARSIYLKLRDVMSDGNTRSRNP